MKIEKTHKVNYVLFFPKIFLVISSLMILFNISIAHSSSKKVFGSYVGTLKHAKNRFDQLAKLDFIVSREKNNKLYLMAVLKLYFGDFNSHEYLAYHYHNVNYDLLTGKLVFDQSNQDLTVISNTFGGGFFDAKIRSKLNGLVGTLVMFKGNTAVPEREFIPQISGNYEGMCDEETATLNLATFKSTEDTLRTGNPFGSYKIEGNISQPIDGLCPNRENFPCITNPITSGSYNFFTGNLKLIGKVKTLDCKVDKDRISCGRCYFIPQKDNIRSANLYSYPTPINILKDKDVVLNSALDSPISSIQGEYTGYLHHEFLNKYQKGSINLLAYQDTINSGQKRFKMSVVANLYFGDESDDEVISYKFSEREYNILGQQFIFERAEDDVDAVLEITSIRENIIEGNWYSLIFGRVGSFKFAKSDSYKIEDKGLVFKSLKGEYVDEKAGLNLSIYLNRTPVNTENPFSPLEFGGTFRYRGGFHEKITVKGGSYDFYTGKIGLQFDHDDRSLVGNFDISIGQFDSLNWSFKHFGAPLDKDFSFSFDRELN